MTDRANRRTRVPLADRRQNPVRKSRPRRLVAALAALVLLVALGAGASGLLTSLSVEAGDAELAKFLLKGARDDLSRKQYDDALRKLEKARDEDASLIETSYWAGVALEAKKDPRGALARYREFKSAYVAKKAEKQTSKDEDGLVALAQARIDQLDAGGAEFARIQDAYVDQLFAFAQANFIRDPTVAARALRMLLAARPQHDEAKRLLEKLGVAAPTSKPAAGADAGAWEDLLANRSIDVIEGWEYVDGMLRIVATEGKAQTTPRYALIDTAAHYVFEAEVRVLASSRANRSIGLGFAQDKELGCFIACLEAKKAFIFRVGGGQDTVDLEIAPLDKPMALDVWYRLELEIDGTRVRFGMDGRSIFDMRITERESLKGRIALHAQEGTFEIRKLRFGRRG
jgi:tetratricopeptide (TPR) repeat protein